MKTRPIIMKPWNVWAILQGQKKETRRLTNRYKMEAGDRFWVREPWRQDAFGFTLQYKADFFLKSKGFDHHLCPITHWKNPTIMPKVAARIMLHLVEVRRERLGDITESGAIAEGIGAFREKEMENKDLWPVFDRNGPRQNERIAGPKDSFIRLWNAINKNDWERDKDKMIWVYRWENFEVIK